MFTVGVMASGLGRLKKIASAYPKLFAEVFEYSQGSKSALEFLTMLASIQQAFNRGQESSEYSSSIVADATVEKGLPSVAAIERTLRDTQPEKYLSVLRRTGLQPLNKQAMIAQEKVLVEAGYLRDAKRLWKKLPADTKTNLAAMGIRGARPWDLYQPALSNPPEAILIRLLNWIEDVCAESERLRKERSKYPNQVQPVVLWKLAGLEKWRPASAVLPKFSGPVDGYMEPSAVISFVLRARNAVQKNDIGQLKSLESKFGPRGMKWLIEDAPGLDSFVKAFDFRSDKGSSLAFDRVVSLTREYWDVMPLEVCECPGMEVSNFLVPAGMEQLVDPMKIPPALMAPGGPIGPVGPVGPAPGPPPPHGGGGGGGNGWPGDGAPGNGFGNGGGGEGGPAPEPMPLPQQQVAPVQQQQAVQQQAVQQQVAPVQQQQQVPQQAPSLPQPAVIKPDTVQPVPAAAPQYTIPQIATAKELEKQKAVTTLQVTKAVAPPTPATTLQKVADPTVQKKQQQQQQQAQVTPAVTIPGATTPTTQATAPATSLTSSTQPSSNVSYATTADYAAAKKTATAYQINTSR